MARRSAIRAKGLRLLRAGLRNQALAAEAVVSLLVASIASRCVPFDRLSRRFGDFVPPDSIPAECSAVLEPEQWRRACAIGWAVRRAAPLMPFRAVCLQQAMAAQAMLARRGIGSVMRFGAARGETRPVDAHAWLDAGNVRLTGYPVPPGLVELGCFVPRRNRP